MFQLQMISPDASRAAITAFPFTKFFGVLKYIIPSDSSYIRLSLTTGLSFVKPADVCGVLYQRSTAEEGLRAASKVLLCAVPSNFQSMLFELPLPLTRALNA